MLNFPPSYREVSWPAASNWAGWTEVAGSFHHTTAAPPSGDVRRLLSSILVHTTELSRLDFNLASKHVRNCTRSSLPKSPSLSSRRRDFALPLSRFVFDRWRMIVTLIWLLNLGFVKDCMPKPLIRTCGDVLFISWRTAVAPSAVRDSGKSGGFQGWLSSRTISQENHGEGRKKSLSSSSV